MEYETYSWKNMGYNMPKHVLWKLIEKNLSLTHKSEADDLPDLHDPLYSEKYQKKSDQRSRFVRLFSYANPTKNIINKIVKFVNNDNVLEVGSGLGLWAHLLSLDGVNVIATDDKSWSFTTGIHNPYTKIETIDNISAIKKYETNVLMIIWPPQGDDMAYNSLKLFKGDKFIYIGELTDPGCNATQEFFELLNTKWKLIDKIFPPRFYAVFDWVCLYERIN